MSKSGEIYMNHRNVSIPKELIGKKIMFRVEIDERRSVRAEER
jgi:putative transposon-encoded protein